MKQFFKRLLGPGLIQSLRLRWLELRAARVSAIQTDGLPVLLQLGAGGNRPSGFINMDLSPAEGVVRANFAKRIPVADDSVDGAFTEHVLEHLEYETQARTFLAECRRVMKKGAVIRIIVPNAGAYLEAYAAGGWDRLSTMRPLDDRHTDCWLGTRYATRMELVNAVFRQHGEHRYAYDAETLLALLADAGFVQCAQCAFGEGKDARLLIDMPERRSESLYVEGVNP